MEFVGWQHTKCGYISQERLECPTCGSALIYDDEEHSKCPYCKKTIYQSDIDNKLKCKGCKDTPFNFQIRFIPTK